MYVFVQMFIVSRIKCNEIYKHPQKIKRNPSPPQNKKKAMESAAKDCSPFHRQRKSSLPIQKKEYEKSCKSAFHILFFWIRKEDFLFL